MVFIHSILNVSFILMISLPISKLQTVHTLKRESNQKVLLDEKLINPIPFYTTISLTISCPTIKFFIILLALHFAHNLDRFITHTRVFPTHKFRKDEDRLEFDILFCLFLSLAPGIHSAPPYSGARESFHW